MKIKAFLIGGLASYLAFIAYQNKDKIISNLSEAKETKDQIQLDLNKIKANLTLIQSEVEKMQTISDDFAYKLRVFNKETQPKINQIKERMEKYQ
ncbi:chemotaxis protein [Streptococcus pseudoporcinus]|uniref:Chemotaxis protein n=1 Tax=Streptococcus pseudoporcinus TaxID=361101 RepID=A0A4U9Y619_9STRE|nr:chemotaxis protein [Streptococcus pseudoporcinus]VTS21372.1 chemotaxis protein [Streptococcus pseudoporcinus]VUC69935.1 chemotaxis protein [Streptococcus pseudoporcinus]VUD00103.1 chemotaxis protein [Streptococcus pseudoporcinus]VUD00495.1 chemotaxis protein [Streptococcus pseudoporcinus]